MELTVWPSVQLGDDVSGAIIVQVFMFQSCGWRPLTTVQTHVMEHNNVSTASITLPTLTMAHGLKG